jgi:hypothetical protein
MIIKSPLDLYWKTIRVKRRLDPLSRAEKFGKKSSHELIGIDVALPTFVG